jgi:hypothetical protein
MARSKRAISSSAAIVLCPASLSCSMVREWPSKLDRSINVSVGLCEAMAEHLLVHDPNTHWLRQNLTIQSRLLAPRR